MKNKLKLMGVLIVMGIVAAVFMVPYMKELLGESMLEIIEADFGLTGSAVDAFIVLLSASMYLTCAVIGVLLYRLAGFKLPVLENWLGIEKHEINWRRFAGYTVLGGLGIGIVLVLGDYIFYLLGSPLSLLESELPAWWKGLLGAYSAGVGEELVYRFFLMTVVALIFKKLLGKETAAVWTGIVVVSVLFGLSHLPATAALVDITPVVVLRAVILNGIPALYFGWLYWKKGLEAAMVAHFFTDVVVHGLVQLI